MTIRDCRHIQPRLSEYIDGALTDDQSWRVRQHLATCSVCARIAEDLSGTVSLLQRLPIHEPSSDFDVRLAQRLADRILVAPRPSLAERLAAWWARPRVRPALVTSGLALAALLPLSFIVQKARAPIHTPLPAVATADAAVAEIWREHVSSESEEPLGGSASGLLVASAADSGERAR